MTHLQINQDISTHIFRAYDIRGVVDDELTPDNVYTIARAIGSEAISRNNSKLIIACDGRLSGKVLSEALAQGLLDSGCDVMDIGAVPTPVLYFATYLFETGSGVMLTGSHNPPNYNGLKIMLSGQAVAGDGIQDLYARIYEQQFHHGKGEYVSVDISGDYLTRITQDIHLSKPMKIVVDAGNGIAGQLAPQLYRALGCEVIELFCDVDGNFPNHHPDPSQSANLVDLTNAVLAEQADLGLAFDGDGDRVGVVTNKGKVIAADRQLMLYAKDVLTRQPNAEIIFDVKCSRLLAEVIKESGGRPVMSKTGHSFIKEKLRQIAAPLAGEMSGHMFFKERWYGFDDGLYTGARCLEILSQQTEDADAIFAKLPEGFGTEEIMLPLADDKKFEFIEKLAKTADFTNSEIISIDGLRVEFTDGWGLVRCSNTTPNLVLRFEADNEQALERIKQEFRQQMLAVEPNLVLEF